MTIGDIDIERIDDGDNIVYKITQDLYMEIVKKTDEKLIELMTKYAKEHNATLMTIPEEKVKIIIDLGCREYLKDYKSDYINLKDFENGEYVSKDKIREKIEEFRKVRDYIISNSEFNPTAEYDIGRNDYCIRMLEDLIGEYKIE